MFVTFIFTSFIKIRTALLVIHLLACVFVGARSIKRGFIIINEVIITLEQQFHSADSCMHNAKWDNTFELLINSTHVTETIVVHLSNTRCRGYNRSMRQIWQYLYHNYTLSALQGVIYTLHIHISCMYMCHRVSHLRVTRSWNIFETISQKMFQRKVEWFRELASS